MQEFWVRGGGGGGVCGVHPLGCPRKNIYTRVIVTTGVRAGFKEEFGNTSESTFYRETEGCIPVTIAGMDVSAQGEELRDVGLKARFGCVERVGDYGDEKGVSSFVYPVYVFDNLCVDLRWEVS